jgi:guanosine-3',5'-bis(diphosphate) 3'-pyrophosphohydrolase
MSDFAHYWRVANRFDHDTDEWYVGLLHDTIEDDLLSYEEILEIHGERIANYVNALARSVDETYAQYIARVRKDPVTREVKIADIEDNLRRGIKNPKGNLRVRYEKALLELRVARHYT